MAVLLFDSQGTLVDFFALAHAIEPHVTAARIAQAITLSWREKMRWMICCTTAAGYKLSMPQVTEVGLRWALEYHAISLQEQAINDILSKSYALPPFADVPDALRSLKEQGHILKIIANPTKLVLERQIEYAKIGEYIDEIVSCTEETGVFKPHPKAMQLGLKKAGVPQEQCIWVASHFMELVGAHQQGFKTAWTNRRLLPYYQIGFTPTYVTTTLLELAHKLEKEEAIDHDPERQAKAVRWAVSEMGLQLTMAGSECPGCDASGRFCHGTRTEIVTPSGVDSQMLARQIASGLGPENAQAVGWTSQGTFYLDVGGLSQPNEASVIKLLSLTGSALNALHIKVDRRAALNVAHDILKEHS